MESAATQAAMPPLPVALPQGADASVRELAFVAQQYAKVRVNLMTFLESHATHGVSASLVHPCAASSRNHVCAMQTCPELWALSSRCIAAPSARYV